MPSALRAFRKGLPFQKDTNREGGEGGSTLPLGMLLALILIAFLLGGGSRPDISSLLLLRPMAIVILAVGLVTLRLDHIRDVKFLFFFSMAVLLLTLLHLVPLPPSIWQSLPGRELIVEIDVAAGLSEFWRPLSLDPVATRNALWSLAVPLATLVWASQLTFHQHKQILVWIMSIGFVSGIIGLLQLVGGSYSSLYFYDVTNTNGAVGLFANRNHNAVFLGCLLPLTASWLCFYRGKERLSRAPSYNWLPLAGFLISAILLAVIMIVGSRAGLIAAIIGSLAAFFIYRFNAEHTQMGSAKKGFTLALVGILTAAGGVGAWFIYKGGRARALDRLLDRNLSEEARLELSTLTYEQSLQYLPWGSGIGSFEKVFKIGEPDHFLGPNYANHAHNDFLEVLMTAGLPGATLTGVALIWLIWAALRVTVGIISHKENLALARAGLASLFILAIASIVDYPLRVPSIQVFATLAVFWLAKYGFSSSFVRSRGKEI